MSCIFCKIVKKEIPAQIVYEDAEIMALKDIHPQAEVHLLVIPKKHLAGLNEVTEADGPLVAKIFQVIVKLAKEFQVAERGYRTVINCNQEGGQTVFHLHVHLLGGRQLGGSMVG